MIQTIVNNRPIKLFILLGGFFIANALIAEFIGVKIFSLEKTLGLTPANFSFFGVDNLSFNLTAGVLLWPVVFVMTDIINEYYGMRGVRLLSWLAAGLIAYAFVMFYFGIHLTPADFWPQSHIPTELDETGKQAILSKVSDYDYAYRLVFGQGLWIIIGSLIAFLIGQIIDVKVFHRIKRMTGDRFIWLRATGSTLISQFIDSFVVLFIAFYIGANWSLSLVLAIGVVNYIYKFVMAIALTPCLYLARMAIEAYLGKEQASELKAAALAES
ncbi:queuosine precursor transporter [Spongiibacter sp. KMU-158]|uniref:Probable queuosine precursor transporter n=1 Tax=Spongiibacter pelagi TaxID=2760804 RepID=A0A927BYQ1_9GAMM|nr:queuosine precursor transporter [Spongiibacter pelagi]MBD2858014.1 queuosine precursor transporter [Spongiibacter pelagi]